MGAAGRFRRTLWSRVGTAAALATMVVVFTPPAVSRGADADRAFSGNVTAFDDTPVVAQAGVRTAIDMVVHGSSGTANDTLSFTLHLAFQGIAYDDSSLNDICIGFDASVQDLALPVPHLSGDATSYDPVSIPLSDISSSSHGCDPVSEPLPATGELELSLLPTLNRLIKPIALLASS